MMIMSGWLRFGSEAPQGVDLQDGRLHQTNQAVEIVDGQQRFLGVLSIAHLPNAAVQALPGMLLEEALARDALRAAHQGQRPADDERRHVTPDLGVVGPVTGSLRNAPT